MSTRDHDDGGRGFLARLLHPFTRGETHEECEHPHARVVDGDPEGDHTTELVCESCGAPLDAHDPAFRRRQRLSEARVCVDCGGTYWTTGTRRSV